VCRPPSRSLAALAATAGQPSQGLPSKLARPWASVSEGWCGRGDSNGRNDRVCENTQQNRATRNARPSQDTLVRDVIGTRNRSERRRGHPRLELRSERFTTRANRSIVGRDLEATIVRVLRHCLERVAALKSSTDQFASLESAGCQIAVILEGRRYGHRASRRGHGRSPVASISNRPRRILHWVLTRRAAR
jgi:hypothetical protein